MKYFQNIASNTAELKKYPTIQYHTLLTKRNASFWKNTKNTKFALIAMGFELFCHDPKMIYMYSNKLGLRETGKEYRNGVFCKLLSEPFDKMYMTRGQGQ